MSRSVSGINTMLGKMILAGGGNEKDSLPIDRLFASWLNADEKILYLPIALQGTRPFAECLNWFESTFHPLSITNIEMWTDLSSHTSDELLKFSAVYIGGGNTYSLLSQLTATGFDQYLISYSSQGGILYGGSAGAAVLGTDIRTIAHIDDNHIGLHDTSGLNLADNHAIWVHYQPQDDAMIFEYCEKFNHPILAISERAGVIIDNSQILSTGYEPVFKFDQINKSQLPEYTYQQ